MKCRFLSDCHTHSHHSPDGSDSVMMLCENAVKKGLYALAVTDHCECEAYVRDGHDRAIRESWKETRRASAAFQGKLRVLTGLELGQPLRDKEAARDILEACDYDFVLGSLHSVSDGTDFYDFDYAKGDIRPAVKAYFEELCEMLAWGGFDSLSHLTYPWRYFSEYGIRLPLQNYQEELDRVLLEVIRQGKSLEVNTSGLRQRIGATMPDLPVLQRYRDLGGKLVTLGSDAHRWGDVGSGIEEGLALLKKAGFTHFAVYVRREPQFLPID